MSYENVRQRKDHKTKNLKNTKNFPANFRPLFRRPPLPLLQKQTRIKIENFFWSLSLSVAACGYVSLGEKF